MRPFLVLALAWLTSGEAAGAQIVADDGAKLPPPVAEALRLGMRTEFGLLLRPAADSASTAAHARMLSTARIRLETTFDSARWHAPGLRIWVAFPSGVDHWHRYTIAQLGARVFRLGGYPAPDLLALDTALATAKGQERTRAELLAAFGDPNGGERLSVYETSVLQLPSGEVVVRLRTDSYQSNAYAPYWTRFAYAFLFGADGELRDWTRWPLDHGG